MMILDPNSLVNTLDHINEKYYLQEAINPEEGIPAARWIVSREGKEGSYRGLFAPTPYDFEQGIYLFTGERLVSGSARHIMGQEAARAAWLLGQADQQVREAYQRSTAWMQADPGFQTSGTYCCGVCTLAFWRHYWVGDFTDKDTEISKGLLNMKDHRIGDGKWRRFPFFYAIYTLLDLDLEFALAELKYAQPVMERYVKVDRAGLFPHRKKTICERALKKISLG